MGIFRRMAGSFAPTTDLENPAQWLLEWAGGRQTASGEFVNPNTSFGLPAYYACVRNVAEDVAKCKPEIRRRRAGPRGGSDSAVDHPAYRMLYGRWAPGLSQFDGTCTLLHYALAWGNGVAEIERNQRGDPVALHPVHPEHVHEFDQSDPDNVRYVITARGGGRLTLDARDVFHIRGLGNSLVGYSVARFHAESVGRGLAGQKAGAAFFGENMTPKIIASVEGAMDADARRAFRKQLGVDKSSDPKGFRKLPIIPHPVKFQQWGIPPKDAQYIETEQFSLEEIQRWFRMPGSKVQNARRAQGWSTLDAEQSDYVTDCLLSWLIRIEQEAEAKLIGESERETTYVKCRVQSLLRGDMTTRTENYNKRFMMATLSPNDIRRLEDENPIDEDWADEYYLQSAMISGEEAASGTEESDEEEVTSPPDDEEPPTEEELDEDDAIARAAEVAWPVFLDVATRTVEKERGALASALKRYASNRPRFESWAAKFYPALESDACDGFATAYGVLTRAAGRSPPARRGAPFSINPPADLRSHLESDPSVLAREIARSVCDACVATLKE